jgi:hypothetical protein
VAYRRQQKYDDALTDLCASLELATEFNMAPHPIALYDLACVESLRNAIPEALKYLAQACLAYPPYRIPAQTEPDLALARADPGFAKALSPSSAQA